MTHGKRKTHTLGCSSRRRAAHELRANRSSGRSLLLRCCCGNRHEWTTFEECFRTATATRCLGGGCTPIETESHADGRTERKTARARNRFEFRWPTVGPRAAQRAEVQRGDVISCIATETLNCVKSWRAFCMFGARKLCAHNAHSQIVRPPFRNNRRMPRRLCIQCAPCTNPLFRGSLSRPLVAKGKIFMLRTDFQIARRWPWLRAPPARKNVHT